MASKNNRKYQSKTLVENQCVARLANLDLGAKAGTNTSILNLNDDCILEIFKYLSIKEHIELASLCTRFETIVKLLYKHSKKLGQNQFNRFRTLDLEELEKGLKIFGIYINDVDFFDFGCSRWESFELIMHYCQNIIYCKLNDEIVSQLFKKNSFWKNLYLMKLQHLVSLTLLHCKLDNDMIKSFSQISTIQYLDLGWSKNINGSHIEKFRHLKSLSLGGCERIESNHFINICANIRKLKELIITYCHKLNTSAFQAMIDYLDELKILKVSTIYETKELHRISKLKKLRCLVIHNQEIYATTLQNIFESLAQDKDDLISLEIYDTDFYNGPEGTYRKQSMPHSIMKNLIKLNNLEILDFSGYSIFARAALCQSDEYISEDLKILLDFIEKSLHLIYLNLSRLDLNDEIFFKIIKILAKQNRAKPITIQVDSSSVSKDIINDPILKENKKNIKIIFWDFTNIVESEIKKNLV